MNVGIDVFIVFVIIFGVNDNEVEVFIEFVRKIGVGKCWFVLGF